MSRYEIFNLIKNRKSSAISLQKSTIFEGIAQPVGALAGVARESLSSRAARRQLNACVWASLEMVFRTKLGGLNLENCRFIRGILFIFGLSHSLEPRQSRPHTSPPAFFVLMALAFLNSSREKKFDRNYCYVVGALGGGKRWKECARAEAKCTLSKHSHRCSSRSSGRRSGGCWCC